MKLAIGFITYGELTAKYLPYFLDSLKKQNFSDYKIFAIDDSEQEENNNKKFIKNNYPEIDFSWAGENLGFGRAFNVLIKKASEIGAEYFLVLNPDIIMEPGAIEKLVEAMDGDRTLGSASPKILKWNFLENKKTNIIDTCGIGLKTGLRFFDFGQGEIDKGQYNKVDILGPSGAAGIYRISALEKLNPLGKGGKGDSLYFDESMFMYKEDCDLAFRLKLANFKARLVPEAIFYHDRTVASAGKGFMAFFRGRKAKNRQAKKWSFLNQHIIFLKYWRFQGVFSKITIILRILAMFIFALLFEQYLLGEYGKLKVIRKKLTNFNI
ncbi:MAG: glycosyltransferase family 2 protein [Patescibacteria group bacterium]